MLSVNVFSILLAAASISGLVSSYKLRDNTEDDIEQSGDFDLSINSRTKVDTDQYQTRQKVDQHSIMKTFSNQQKAKQPSTPAQQPPPDKPKSKQINLNEDVNDFIEIIPKSEVKAKIEEYYRNDMDTQHMFEFMHSKEFQELRRNVLDMADVKDILQYLNRNGMNVKGVVRKLDNRLGISKIRPTSLSYASPQSLGIIFLMFFFLHFSSEFDLFIFVRISSHKHNHRWTEWIGGRYPCDYAARRNFYFVL